MNPTQLDRKARNYYGRYDVFSVNRLSESEMLRLIVSGHTIYSYIMNPSKNVTDAHQLASFLKNI